MPKKHITETVSVVLLCKVTRDKKKDLNKLLSEETEWLGEPKSPDGCVISAKYKYYSLEGKYGT